MNVVPVVAHNAVVSFVLYEIFGLFLFVACFVEVLDRHGVEHLAVFEEVGACGFCVHHVEHLCFDFSNGVRYGCVRPFSVGKLLVEIHAFKRLLAFGYDKPCGCIIAVNKLDVVGADLGVYVRICFCACSGSLVVVEASAVGKALQHVFAELRAGEVGVVEVDKFKRRGAGFVGKYLCGKYQAGHLGRYEAACLGGVHADIVCYIGVFGAVYRCAGLHRCFFVSGVVEGELVGIVDGNLLAVVYRLAPVGAEVGAVAPVGDGSVCCERCFIEESVDFLADIRLFFSSGKSVSVYFDVEFGVSRRGALHLVVYFTCDGYFYREYVGVRGDRERELGCKTFYVDVYPVGIEALRRALLGTEVLVFEFVGVGIFFVVQAGVNRVLRGAERRCGHNEQLIASGICGGDADEFLGSSLDGVCRLEIVGFVEYCYQIFGKGVFVKTTENQGVVAEVFDVRVCPFCFVPAGPYRGLGHEAAVFVEEIEVGIFNLVLAFDAVLPAAVCATACGVGGDVYVDEHRGLAVGRHVRAGRRRRLVGGACSESQYGCAQEDF